MVSAGFSHEKLNDTPDFSMDGTVSIILPCYNVAPYLDECLESLVRQTWEDLEIICVNDGSTDDTPAVLRGWAEKDARIRVIHQENGGAFSARNAGLDAAAGEYIGFVDPDDYVDTSMYARLVETAQRHGAEVAACGYTSFSEEDGTVMEDAGHAPEPGFEPDAKKSCFSGESVWLRMDVVVWNKVYRRSFFEENGLRMKPGFRGGEDDIFWLTALPHASRLAVIPDQLYFYRRKRAGSLSDVRQGWLAHIMKRYLLAHVTSAEEIFRRLDEEERRGLAARYRKWLKGVEIGPGFAGLNKWDRAFCRLLGAEPVKLGPCARLHSTLMSACSGRKGRYHRLKLLLSGLS